MKLNSNVNGRLFQPRRHRAAHLHERVRAALGEGVEEFAGSDGVRARASSWIVSAVAPA
jgi:hypothetical protein